MRVITTDMIPPVALVNLTGETVLAFRPGVIPPQVVDQLDRLMVLVPSPDMDASTPLSAVATA